VTELDRRDVHEIEEIPVTSPARTLLDLAPSLGARALEQAVAEGYALRLVNSSALATLLARYRGRGGTRQLRAILDGDAPPAITRSAAEERLLTLIRAARLPPPETNVRVGPYEVDFLWRASKLAVEVDGFAFHSSRPKFERDRERDAALTARGLRVVRVTWRAIEQRPETTIALISRSLGHEVP
jgi:very-short-patch-repair endonuclease